MELDDLADPVPSGPAELDDERKLARRRPDNHADRLFHERARRLHKLGPRATGELINEILAGACPAGRALVREKLERYGELDPTIVRLLGGADWIDQADVIRAVGGRS
jgi:hypothetical protein